MIVIYNKTGNQNGQDIKSGKKEIKSKNKQESKSNQGKRKGKK